MKSEDTFFFLFHCDIYRKCDRFPFRDGSLFKLLRDAARNSLKK